jgi:3-dehydroquinate synthase
MNTKTKMLYGGLRALAKELSSSRWQGAKFTILLDENGFQHCLPKLISMVEPLQEAEFIEVPVGEECKTLEVAAQIWQTLMEGEAGRDAVLVNLGGGCVCDLGGFVAAGYKRGIRHINIPTTVVAMADAAIGGKTAINFGGVKNSIGHFYPAELIVIDPAFIDTLPKEEIVSGQFEMIKTGIVTDPELFTFVMGADGVYGKMINQVARMKARVVKADPYDHSIRHILNFGHTFGHAIEVYSHLPHGIAVGLGMMAEMYLSVKKTGFPDEIYNAYSQWLKKQLSILNSQFSVFNLKDVEQMLPLMRQDKKNIEGTIRCVLLQEIGVPVIDVEISDNEVRDAMLTVFGAKK